MEIILEAEKRNPAVKPKNVRKQGRIPAVSYGRKRDTTSLTVEYQRFRKVFEQAGESTIVQLRVNDQQFPVLIHDVQQDPVSDEFTHADFYLVDMEKEVITKIPVKTVGISPAVKNLGGILTVHKHEITIRCLPKDLIREIIVDVSSLENFHSSIHVHDLQFPPAIKILDNLDDTVANARPPKIEEEAPKPEAVVAAEGAAGAGAAPAATEAAPAGKEASVAGKEASVAGKEAAMAKAGKKK